MNFDEYLKKRLLYAILPLVLLGGFIYILATEAPKAFSAYQARVQIEKDYAQKQEDLERERANSQNLTKEQDFKKEIYTVTDGTDSVSASGLILEEILNFAKETGLKLVSIEYSSDAASVSDRLDKVTITTNFISTYNGFNNYLNKLINFNYLVGLTKIDIKPYENDKTKILTNFAFDIYIGK